MLAGADSAEVRSHPDASLSMSGSLLLQRAPPALGVRPLPEPVGRHSRLVSLAPRTATAVPAVPYAVSVALDAFGEVPLAVRQCPSQLLRPRLNFPWFFPVNNYEF